MTTATPGPFVAALAGRATTLYRALVREGILGPPLEFVNADPHERAHLQHITSGEERSRAARTWADGRRATLLATRTPLRPKRCSRTRPSLI